MKKARESDTGWEGNMHSHQTVFGRLGSTIDACVAWQIRKVYEDIILAISFVPERPCRLN
jgi:hypothetical protein